MKALKKYAPIGAACLAVVGLILYFFAPMVKWEMFVADTANGIDCMTEGEFVFMILATALVMVAGIALAVVSYFQPKNQAILYAAAACLLVAGILCFFAKSFFLSVNNIPSEVADYYKLGVGSIIAGILSILSSAAVLAPKYLK